MDMQSVLINKKNEIEQSINKTDGDMSIRQRIDALFDEKSFIELNMFEGFCADHGQAVITGYGTVGGRLVYAYAANGVLTVHNANKIANCIDRAKKVGAICVALTDGLKTALTDKVASFSAFSRIIDACANARGTITMITGVFGKVSGTEIYPLALSDFVFMTKDTSRIYTQGANTIEDKNIGASFGDAEYNAKKTGLCAGVCENDADCIQNIKKLIQILPSNNVDGAEIIPCTDDLNRLTPHLLSDDAPRQALMSVLDEGSMMEVYSSFAPDMTTAFGRINGRTVLVIATSGNMCSYKCKKAIRLIEYANSFNIPVVTFMDVTGYAQDDNDLIREISDLYTKYHFAKVPKVTVITGHAYTSAALAFCGKESGADVVYAYGGAKIAPATPSVGANILYEEEIKQSADPIQARNEMTQKYEDTDADVYNAAKVGFVDDVIDPTELRPRVAAALEMLFTKKR